MEEANYTYGGAAKILEIPESKLRYWAQVGFVGPSGRRGGKPVYSFQDLVSVKAAKELTERGFKPAEIRKAIDEVRSALPHVDRPLDRIRVAFDGTRLVVVDGESAYEPTGQKVFDFGLGDLAKKMGARPGVLGPAGSRPPTEAAAKPATPLPSAPAATASATATAFTAMRSAYDWFVEGTRAEIVGGDDADGRAEKCYRQALTLDPGLAAARTNLGSLAYRRGDISAAREAYEAALALDPDQPEARFNLANLVLEAGIWSSRWLSCAGSSKAVPTSPTRTTIWRWRSSVWAGDRKRVRTSNDIWRSNRPRPPGRPRPVRSSPASTGRGARSSGGHPASVDPPFRPSVAAGFAGGLRISSGVEAKGDGGTAGATGSGAGGAAVGMAGGGGGGGPGAAAGGVAGGSAAAGGSAGGSGSGGGGAGMPTDPSPGCTTATASPTGGHATIDVSGTAREYILSLPGGYDPSPVLTRS